MRKSIWEMLGETLREAALVVLAVGLIERIFAGGVTAADTAVVVGVSVLTWLSGAWIEETRKE